MSIPCGSVARLGLTPLKGAAHTHPEALAITRAGPDGDRRFALVEEHPHRGTAVLRTAENPTILRVRAELRGADLHLRLPGGRAFTVRAAARTGTALVTDYWGRSPTLETLPGPWDDALSELLERQVSLARTTAPGDVVYAEPVTLVTTSSLRELARRGGAGPVDDERFRATVLVDTGDATAFVEDDWVGRVVHLGGVRVRVRSHVARCPVTRLVPGSGTRAADDPLRLLAPDRTVGGEIVFGIGAAVVDAGTVEVGDPVVLG